MRSNNIARSLLSKPLRNGLFSVRNQSTNTSAPSKDSWPILSSPGPLAIGGALSVLAYLWYSKPEEKKASAEEGSRNVSGGAPGDDKSLKKEMGGLVSSTIQSYSPIRQFDQHTEGFTFLADDKSKQMKLHSFCSYLNDDVAQCVLYDSDKSNAKMIGVEYTISDKIYKSLPPDEKPLWTSNAYEVKSGLVTAPRLPSPLERALMKELITTYSKSVILWQPNQDPVPQGVPQFSYKFTNDGQIKPELVKQRDERMGTRTEDLRRYREDIVPDTKVDLKDDQWKNPTKLTVSK